MQILFIYSVQNSLLRNKPLKGQEDIQMGLAQLSAVLKGNNHTTDILILDRKYKTKNHKNIDKKIQQNNYKLICYSSVYSEFDFIKQIAQYIKSKYNIFSILGGVHATISPEESYLNIFDALCIGEGENALAELALKIETNQSITNIDNLWLKQNGIIVKNKTKEFIQDLDTLPFVDRDLWQSHIFNTNTRLTVLLGRGCPYNCSYCCNHKIKKAASGNYVRLRSVNNILEEINMLTIKFPDVTGYFLEIETLGVNMNWLQQLCESLYNFNNTRQNKLFFSTNLRVTDNLNLDFVFDNLKKANFESVTIGLESGSERIRREILNRNYSNTTIVKAVEIARKYGIKVGLFNLIGLPTETLSDFKQTLHLNQQLQPDWHATSIFFPYKGTILHELSKDSGLLPDNINFNNERQYAVLNMPYFNKKQVQSEFDNFHYNVYKSNPNKTILKTTLYLIQKFVGHHNMATIKNKLIVFLHRLSINNKLLNIIQKS